jgi:hypothetical protein
MWIIFGENQRAIGVDEFPINCPSCEKESIADIMVLGKYFHIFALPIIPIEKNANIICKECGLKRSDVPFNTNVFNNYKQISTGFRYPWYMYIGLSVVVILIMIIIWEASS